MRRRNIVFLSAAFTLLPLFAQREEVRRASIRPGGDHGKCTIEVDVDEVADVIITGDTARIRTLQGAPSFFRRFECNQPLPANPADFRFSGVDGRGRQTLIQDPRQGRGAAVVRIEDPKSGREGYTFDIEWRGGSPYGGNYGDGGNYGGGYGSGGVPTNLVQNCQDAVRDKAARDYGYRNIDFVRVDTQDNRSRRDFVQGVFEASRNGYREQFQFSCSVNYDDGRVRSVDIIRASGQEGGYNGPGYPPDPVRACENAAGQRLQNDGYSDIRFSGTGVDSRRGDLVTGSAQARDRYGNSRFNFSCSIDSRGAIRNVDVVRR